MFSCGLVMVCNHGALVGGPLPHQVVQGYYSPGWMTALLCNSLCWQCQNECNCLHAQHALTRSFILVFVLAGDAAPTASTCMLSMHACWSRLLSDSVTACCLNPPHASTVLLGIVHHIIASVNKFPQCIQPTSMHA